MKENGFMSIRDGFYFGSITWPVYIKDTLIVKKSLDVASDGPGNYRVRRFFSKPGSSRSAFKLGEQYTTEECVQYINENKIEKLSMVWDDLSFIKKCPSVRYLSFRPSEDMGDGFDYSCLYDSDQFKMLNCDTEYGPTNHQYTSIDYRFIQGLEELSIHSDRHINFQNIMTLKSLFVMNYTADTLYDLFHSRILDTLTIEKCKITTLDGIGQSERMQCLYLRSNSRLKDITSLKDIGNSLKALRIVKCPKIEDFSVLAELKNLELLELKGNNTLPDLKFLDQLPKLSYFSFGMNLDDGDLTPCLRKPHVEIPRKKKNYNLTNADMNKTEDYLHGNENVDFWRRLE